MKHKISWAFVLPLMLVFLGCEEIERVREENGICSPEFTEAYNLLGDEISKLPQAEGATKYEEQLALIQSKCADFFATYEQEVQCDAFQGENRVTVKGADYALLCEDPRRVEYDLNVPGKIVREDGENNP